MKINNRRKFNIVIYNGDFNLPTFVGKLGEHLSKKGHKVTFMGHSSQFFSYKEADIFYYSLPFYNDNFKFGLKALFVLFQILLSRPREISSIIRTLKKDYKKNKGQKGRKDWLMDFIRLGACKIIKPDVIHNQWSPALAALEPLFEHYPIVQSLHANLEDFTPFYNSKIARIYHKFFPKVSGFQCVSHETLSNASFFGISTKNIKITHANVDKSWLIDKSRINYQNPENRPINIISVGDYVWRKGHVYALEAMQILKKKGLTFSFKIIGKGDDTECRFHVSDLGLEKNVTLQNKTPHEQLYHEMENADIFLLASIQEGFGAVISEAMALGIPIISSNANREPVILKDQKNSFVIPAMNSQAIAEAVERLIGATQSEIEQIIKNARNTVEEQLTYEAQLPNYLEIYKNALN